MQTKTELASGKRGSKFSHVSIQSYSLLLFCAIISAGMSYLLYKQTEFILEDRLKERLIGIVSTASLIFSPSDLELIQDETAVGTQIYNQTVQKLQDIRQHNNDLRYAYILRPTDNPDVHIYIADADTIDPLASIDLNKDNVIDEQDALATPGDEYDVSEIPALRNDARYIAVTDAEPVSDQWGNFLSGYAPILKDGQTIAILGIDIEVSDYLRLIRRTLIPFLAFVVFLLATLTLMTFALVKVWNQQVELVKDLDRQKDELLGLVAHQLAAPITAMKWSLEMFLSGDLGKLPKDQQKQLEEMQLVSTDLADLVSMILDVSRIQLGRIKIEKQPLDLAEFFKEILLVIEPRAKEKHMKFKVSLPKQFPAISLDKRYTRMTIENLLTNAVKYTPEGGEVDFTVKVEGGKVRCTVKDTGIGIPKADQDKIFGKLYRASNARNSKMDGNGFGLYIAKAAVDSQGGSIGFTSEEGKGTTFTVELPIIGPQLKAA